MAETSIWDSISKAADTFSGYFDRSMDYLTAREEFNFRSDAMRAGLADPGLTYGAAASTGASGWTNPGSSSGNGMMMMIAIAGLAVAVLTYLKR